MEEEKCEMEMKDGAIVTVELSYDEDAQDYLVRELPESQGIYVFDDGNSFWNGARKIFGDNVQTTTLDRLIRGEVLEVKKRRKVLHYVVGIERYRHSGDVLAVCGMGSFPDRQWDVSPLVGFVVLDAEDGATKENALERAEAGLEHTNLLLRGEVWFADIAVTKNGETKEEALGGIAGTTDEAVSVALDSFGYTKEDIAEYLVSL